MERRVAILAILLTIVVAIASFSVGFLTGRTPLMTLADTDGDGVVDEADDFPENRFYSRKILLYEVEFRTGDFRFNESNYYVVCNPCGVPFFPLHEDKAFQIDVWTSGATIHVSLLLQQPQIPEPLPSDRLPFWDFYYDPFTTANYQFFASSTWSDCDQGGCTLSWIIVDTPPSTREYAGSGLTGKSFNWGLSFYVID